MLLILTMQAPGERIGSGLRKRVLLDMTKFLDMKSTSHQNIWLGYIILVIFI